MFGPSTPFPSPTRLGAFLAAIITLGFLRVTPVGAQQHRATRLGNPATRFADPLQTPDDLRRMFRSEALRADIAFIATESGFKGDLEDLRRAVTNVPILELKIPVKTLLPAMSTRENGKPILLREVLWAGTGPIEAYEFYFASKGQRYRVVTPKACSNFWVEDYGKELRSALALQCRAPAEVLIRRPLEVCLALTNSGDAAEAFVRVSLPVPAGAELMDATGAGRADAGHVVWDIPALLDGGATNLCARFIPTHTATLSFAASAHGRSTPKLETTCETRVAGIPAIQLEVVDIDDPIEVGSNETYEIQVLNQGSAVLTNVKLVCTLEESQEFVSGSGASRVQADGRTIQVTALPELQPADKAVWRVVVKTLTADDVRFTTELTADQFSKPIRETEATRQY